ncbi:MAG: methyltransferase type 11 [Phenylobacterium zucineum]|nr:MAG: methyltransferase type 11 [Phenylobacterium zucineum]
MTAPRLDRGYLAPDVPSPVRFAHTTIAQELLAIADKPGFRILEIGSRQVSSSYRLRDLLQHAEYVGFDYYDGPNVDVAGDAHRLSELVEGQFDAVYSTAVFEHLAMPWVVVEEIAKVLKVGGHVFIETHFSFSSHERPWNFFQFSDMGLRALFSPALGFECVEASMDNPIVGRFSAFAAPYLRFQPVTGLYCHSLFVGRKARDVPGFRWRDADVGEIVGATHYPPPQ